MKRNEKKMSVLVVDSAHLLKDVKGDYYANAIYDDKFFARYLQVFDMVKFTGKVKYIDEVKSTYIKINDSRVEIVELPWYQGMKQMIGKIPQIFKVLYKATRQSDCYIFRVLQLESIFAFILRKKNKLLAVEVVNDPESWMEFSRPIRWCLGKVLRRMIDKAVGVSYVTQYYLQKKYPCNARKRKKNRDNYFESHYSSVELNDNDINSPKCFGEEPLKELKLVHVANCISGDSKGHKTVLCVISELKKEGYDVSVDFIGDGPSVPDYMNMAKKLDVTERIKFIGRIREREKMLNRMQQYDLFIFPTYSEGLPRSVIEACAVGVPCLSTPVCGIPELLSANCLISADDVEGYKNKIIDLMKKPQMLTVMSEENIKTAQKYCSDILNTRRQEFYKKLREAASGDGEKN